MTRDVPVFDPRPVVMTDDGEVTVRGAACTSCDYTTVIPTWRCPVCGGDLRERAFGPDGTVWSYTVVRIAYGDRQPPYAIAYVDLDGGPRLLARIAGSIPVDDLVGHRACLAGVTAEGDPEVEVAA